MNNSEILYLYDAKLTNPNGDPDEENRPRMDEEREINLVSDLRLKRYIRDYISEKGYLIYVRKLNEEAAMPADVIKFDSITTKEDALKSYVDVRLFGATMAINRNSMAFTGPVQFNWGYSLNKVELLEAGITSHFATGENKTQGTMGKDYRVKYSFIAFSGAVSGKRAEKTKLTEDDLSLLDTAMKNAIKEQFTRSKIGQYPRLYLRVEYKDNETIYGDMRKYISLVEKNESVRDISEIAIEAGSLKRFLEQIKSNISIVHYFADSQLELTIDGKKASIDDLLSNVQNRPV